MSARPVPVSTTSAAIGSTSTFEWGVLVVIASAAFFGGQKLSAIDEKLEGVVRLLEAHDRRIEGNAARIQINERVLSGHVPRIERLERDGGK